MLGGDVVREAAAVRRLVSLTGQFASVDADLTVSRLVTATRTLTAGTATAPQVLWPAAAGR